VSDSRRPKRVAPPGGDDRQALLARGAILTGEQWAQRCRKDLRKQGRRVIGGWPGTLSEARARAEVHSSAELRRLGLAQLTFEELERLAHATYASARDYWLSRAEREDPTDG
jgi:hypothetical protein